METKSTIGLCMIIKSDEPIEMVKRAIDSVKEVVDDIFITITKSSDKDDTSKLEKALQEYNAKISYFQWVNDFSAARNYNMSQVTNPYLIWIDCDDVVQNPQAIPSILEDMVVYNQAAVFLKYLYLVELDEQNKIREILIEHKRERIIRNDGTFKWIGMLHETLIQQRQENIVKAFRKECTIVHLSSGERFNQNIERNIKILEAQAAKEEHGDPRTLVYLAKAYADKAISISDATQSKIYYDLAWTLFEEYIEGSGQAGKPGYREGSGWPEERAIAFSYLSEIARRNNKFDLAIRCLHNALIENPNDPMYYIDLALTYAMIKQFAKAKHWLMLATSVPDEETTLIRTPRDLKSKALEADYSIALDEGDLERAIKDSEMLCEILLNNQALKERLEKTKGFLADNQAAQSIVYLGKYLEERKEETKLPFLVQAIPETLQQEKFASEMRHKFLPSRTWGNNEITILAGPGFEQWSPKSLKTGLGGSESAIVYLSRELTKLGWKITVYANPMQDMGNHRGVKYRPWHQFNIKDRFNILVMWRMIGLVDINPRAKYKIMWAHDYPQNPDFTEERIKKVDKIAVLSEYHKSLFRMQDKEGKFVLIPEEKFFLTSNGIIPVKTKKNIERNPYRMIYSSSYDRGLIYLLTNWPLIKKDVPQAELHIFYGWDLYNVIHSQNPASMRWKQQMSDLMQQDGIKEHGRIGHEQLAEEYMKSGILAYPCDFSGEISTIVAMEAQTYGAIPMVIDRFALKETVKNGIRVDVDIQTNEGQKTYVGELVKLLNDSKWQEEIREPMMKFAREHFPWFRVARQWSSLLSYLKDTK